MTASMINAKDDGHSWLDETTYREIREEVSAWPSWKADAYRQLHDDLDLDRSLAKSSSGMLARV